METYFEFHICEINVVFLKIEINHIVKYQETTFLPKELSNFDCLSSSCSRLSYTNIDCSPFLEDTAFLSIDWLFTMV